MLTLSLNVFHLLNACLIYRIKYEIVIPRSSAHLANGKGALQYGIMVLQLLMKERYNGGFLQFLIFSQISTCQTPFYKIHP
jgi:hypothetical protein